MAAAIDQAKRDILTAGAQAGTAGVAAYQQAQKQLADYRANLMAQLGGNLPGNDPAAAAQVRNTVEQPFANRQADLAQGQAQFTANNQAGMDRAARYVDQLGAALPAINAARLAASSGGGGGGGGGRGGGGGSSGAGLRPTTGSVRGAAEELYNENVDALHAQAHGAKMNLAQAAALRHQAKVNYDQVAQGLSSSQKARAALVAQVKDLRRKAAMPSPLQAQFKKQYQQAFNLRVALDKGIAADKAKLAQTVPGLDSARTFYDTTNQVRNVARAQFQAAKKGAPGAYAMGHGQELIDRLASLGYNTDKLDPLAAEQSLGPSYDAAYKSARTRNRLANVPVDVQKMSGAIGVDPMQGQKIIRSPAYRSGQAFLTQWLNSRAIDASTVKNAYGKNQQVPAYRENVDDILKKLYFRTGNITTYRALAHTYLPLFPRAPKSTTGTGAAGSPQAG